MGLWLTIILVLFTSSKPTVQPRGVRLQRQHLRRDLLHGDRLPRRHVIIGTIFLAVACSAPTRPFCAATASRIRVRRLVLALRRRGLAVSLRVHLRVGLRWERRRRALTPRTRPGAAASSCRSFEGSFVEHRPGRPSPAAVALKDAARAAAGPAVRRVPLARAELQILRPRLCLHRHRGRTGVFVMSLVGVVVVGLAL